MERRRPIHAIRLRSEVWTSLPHVVTAADDDTYNSYLLPLSLSERRRAPCVWSAEPGSGRQTTSHVEPSVGALPCLPRRTHRPASGQKSQLDVDSDTWTPDACARKSTVLSWVLKAKHRRQVVSHASVGLFRLFIGEPVVSTGGCCFCSPQTARTCGHHTVVKRTITPTPDCYEGQFTCLALLLNHGCAIQRVVDRQSFGDPQYAT